jgi:hypothetical protein
VAQLVRRYEKSRHQIRDRSDVVDSRVGFTIHRRSLAVFHRAGVGYDFSIVLVAPYETEELYCLDYADTALVLCHGVFGLVFVIWNREAADSCACRCMAWMQH